MIIYIGIDDTDTIESRGTGRLAREIAAELEKNRRILGVTRHQLLVDPRIPYTSHNSSAAIVLIENNHNGLQDLFEQIRARMLADFQIGSDPGLCLAEETFAIQVSSFGKLAQHELVSQSQARLLASENRIFLEGLGGTEDGIIGALAAVGLAASGDDGRYLQFGRSRELNGMISIPDLKLSGVAEVRTLDGSIIENGLVEVEKLRPARRNHQPVLFVEKEQEIWRPLKLD